jgi:hypothetical protein
LARRGVAADFRALHFHWFRGLVADDLRVSWGGPDGPRMTIAEADLDLAPPPWNAGRQIIRGLAVRRGSLVLPLPVTNQPPRALHVENIAADIRFLPGDAWEVRRLGAQVLGFQLELRATLTNLASLHRARPTSHPAAAAQRIQILRNALEEVANWRFGATPSLVVDLDVDGRAPWAASGGVYLDVPQVHTPHGALRRLRLSLRALPSTTNQAALTSSVIHLEELQTSKGGFTGLEARLDLRGPPAPALPTNAIWHGRLEHLFLRGLRGRHVRAHGTNDLIAPESAPISEPARWPVLPLRTRALFHANILDAGPSVSPLRGTDVNLTIDAGHHRANLWPVNVDFDLELGSLAGGSESLGRTQVGGSLQRREAAEPAEIPPGLAWWEALWPLEGRITVISTNLRSPRLRVTRLETQLHWRPPVLTLPSIAATLYGGELQAAGELNVATREASLDAETTFDLHGLDALLGPRSRTNFTRYQWREPPWFRGSARATLPAWTDPHPDWDATVKPTLRLDGRFRVGAGAFKGIPFDQAASSISFDGERWTLPDLETARPEGRQQLAVDYNEETREYRIHARGRVFPHVLKPVLGENSAEVLDLFESSQAVTANLSVWGPWNEGTRQSIHGTLQATNFQFRGQHFEWLDAGVIYTNRVLIASPLTLQRGAGELTADGVRYSFANDTVWLTNVINTIDPAVVAATIAPDLPHKIAPYRFEHPPRIKVDGTLQPRHTESADLQFEIVGGPFRFWRLSAAQIQTRLLWQGSQLVLTNTHALFYGGRLDGFATFDLSTPRDALYQFDARVRDASLARLLRDAIAGRTNHAEGNFDLDLIISSARTADLNSWNGHGEVHLRDGLLWDVPIFGFLSPVLNGIVPGLGNNRAEQADAHFTIHNGIIGTRDLVVVCPPAKLLYRGEIDFEQRVDAKVEGQILSAIGGFGPLFTLVLRPLTKLLEFRVTGTLSNVETEPLYIPKFLLLPLQPVKILRGWFGGNDTDPPSARDKLPPSPDPP